MLLGANARAATRDVRTETTLETPRLNPVACDICNRIFAIASAPVQESTEEILGNLQDLLRGDCTHVTLFENVRKAWPQVKHPKYRVQDHSILNIKARKWMKNISFEPILPSRKARPDDQLRSCWELVCREDVPGHPGTSLYVNEQWIDLDVLRRRIALCDMNHGKRCGRGRLSRKEDMIRPRYLVDTHRACLVHGEVIQPEYVALSYQWGQIDSVRNNTQLCKDLLVTGSLATEEVASRIPQTIRDAFALVKLLRYRYLWVDSLCIVQDDHQQLRSELSQMHRIYNSATFAIIAKDGLDANYGLRGLKGTTAPRRHKRTYVRLSNSEMLVQTNSMSPLDNRVPSKYQERAWTFQEQLMSRRAIHFASGAIEWQCNHGSQAEYDLLLPDHLYKRSDFQFQSITRNMPTPMGLNTAIGLYNQRELSFPEDAFAAFAGVQSMLERNHADRFLYGLPEFWFDIALNWTPSSHEGIVRRVPSEQHRSFRQPYQLPSWSWLGWAGQVAFPADAGLRMNDRYPNPCFTVPVTTWYTMPIPSSNERRIIGSGWYKHRLLVRDTSAILPIGWKRIWMDDGDLKKLALGKGIVPDCLLEQQYYFKHDKAKLKYRYPFPTSLPYRGEQEAPSLQTAYLFARTERAYMCGQTISPTRVRYKRDGYSFSMWLIRPNGQHVGYIQLHNSKDMEAFEPSKSPHSMELVATCKGYTANVSVVGEDWNVFPSEEGASEQRRIGRHLFRTPKVCYFVLWIEWIDGVAYRKASGAVAAEAWEQDREEELVDLILG